MSRKYTLFSMIVCAAFLMVGVSYAQESTPEPEEPRRIVFTSARDGNFEIYTMLTDGSDLTRLTTHRDNDYAPSWSPDRSQIAFVAGPHWSRNHLYVMNADGTDRVRLSTEHSAYYLPDWSPDGTTLVFEATLEGTHGDLFSIPATGGEITRLTTARSRERNPHYSPDGSSIVFASDQNGNFDLYLLRDGEWEQLTDDPANEYPEGWSDDGSQILFSSNALGNFDIYLLTVETGEVEFFIHPPGEQFDVLWTQPDEAFFTSSHEGHFEIYRTSLDGRPITNITNNSSDDFYMD